MKTKHIIFLASAALAAPYAMAQTDSISAMFAEQQLEVGANKGFAREMSTAAVSVITNDVIEDRGGKNIGNAILGQGKGLMSLQGNGTYFYNNPTFYIRGLQSLSGSTPLILVDGIERNIDLIDPDEVEEVQILKDAAATALYGYRGNNGVLLVKTKRGEYNSQKIKVRYDHVFRNMTNRPKMIDGATYANAMNEALGYEGQSPRYSADEVAAFQSGAFPYQYPSVNWVNQTFRRHGEDNRASIEFSGGGKRFRYFTIGTILSDKGFIKNVDENKGYSTQDKYVRGNIRTNLDIDLTPTTMLQANIFGSLSEMSAPGANVNLWNMVYTLPSVAFPVKSDTGDWGGSSTWAGTGNPVAQSTGAAYYKLHERALYFDATLSQDLGMVTKGLSATVAASYDTYSTLAEDHSKEYVYGYYPITGWADGKPVLGDYWQGGKEGEMGTSASTNSYQRRFNVKAGFNYDRTFAEKHNVYAQLMYNYDFEETTGVNTKIYRRNYTFMGQYTFNRKAMLAVQLVESGSSRLAPGTKWAFSPTVSAAYVFINNPVSNAVNFLKLRASFGKLNCDYLPDGSWTYYTQNYQTSGVTYPWGSGFDSNNGQTTVGQMAVANPGHEKADKYNVGVDASFWNAITLSANYFFSHRYDIWINGSGAYSALIGFTAPYLNGGIVDNQGVDVELNFSKQFGDVTLNLGGSFTYAKNKIKEQGEEPQAYANLVQTGNPLSSMYGLIAEGLFKDDAEIAASPVQTFSTVRPGDIRYRDVNEDGKIDANDVCKIGYSSVCPEIYYTFSVGAEYKGVGFNAHFQGTGHYDAMLNASGYYWGLVNNLSLSQEAYDGRWTPDNLNAKYPRVSSNNNQNNYQNSTFWLRDRSFLKLRNVEVYYNFDKNLLAKTHFIKGAKVYVRGLDLFTHDHIKNKDAEVLGNVVPPSREIVLGAQLTF